MADEKLDATETPTLQKRLPNLMKLLVKLPGSKVTKAPPSVPSP